MSDFISKDGGNFCEWKGIRDWCCSCCNRGDSVVCASCLLRTLDVKLGTVVPVPCGYVPDDVARNYSVGGDC